MALDLKAGDGVVSHSTSAAGSDCDDGGDGGSGGNESGEANPTVASAAACSPGDSEAMGAMATGDGNAPVEATLEARTDSEHANQDEHTADGSAEEVEAVGGLENAPEAGSATDLGLHASQTERLARPKSSALRPLEELVGPPEKSTPRWLRQYIQNE